MFLFGNSANKELRMMCAQRRLLSPNTELLANFVAIFLRDTRIRRAINYPSRELTERASDKFVPPGHKMTEPGPFSPESPARVSMTPDASMMRSHYRAH